MLSLSVDNRGGLHMLRLKQFSHSSAQLDIDALGKVSAASSISYLDEGVVYVGSHFGDSQVY